MARKKTKSSTKVSAAKNVQLPNDLPGSSLSKEERRKKMDIIINDFNVKAAQYKQEIIMTYRKQVEIIEKEFTLVKNALPQQIKDMTLGEYVERGGTLDAVRDSLQAANSVELPQGPDLSLCKIEEEENGKENKMSTVKKMPVRARKKASKLGASASRPNTGQGRFTSMSYVTPKFNTLLASTNKRGLINTRRAKPTDKVLMSLDGSPVDNPTEEIKRNQEEAKRLGDLLNSIRGDTSNLTNFRQNTIRKIDIMFTGMAGAAKPKK